MNCGMVKSTEVQICIQYICVAITQCHLQTVIFMITVIFCEYNSMLFYFLNLFLFYLFFSLFIFIY